MENATRERTGGRSARVRAGVLEATLKLLDDGETPAVPTIAARAGVAASSVYRRWGTWENVVADALLDESATAIPVPDTGTVREDLLTFATSLAAYLRTPRGAGLLRVAVNVERSEAFDAARTRFWGERLGRAESIIHRAIARGQLPEHTDARLVVEMLVAPLHLRTLLLGTDPAAHLQDEIDLLLYGLGGQP